MTSNGTVVSAIRQEPIRRTFERFRREIRNWYSAGLLACVVLPTRVTPAGGFGGQLLRNLQVTFRMRDGSNIRCRLRDAGDVFSVYVHQDYARYPIAWDSVSTIIDIGATVGSFTIWAASRAEGARLIAVEPNPELYQFLSQNIGANGLVGRASVMPVAVGAVSGYGSMVEAEYSTVGKVSRQRTSAGSQFRIATLDELMARMGGNRCDLLKMDCEGSEYEILLGCSDTVLRGFGAIICEYHPIEGRTPEELVDRLVQLNFHTSVSGGRDYGFLFATGGSLRAHLPTDPLRGV